MRDPAPWVCDGIGCGKHKGPSNRWWLVYDSGAYQSEPDPLASAVVIRPWDDAVAGMDNVFHACSESCALKLASDWMAWAQITKGQDQQLWQPKSQSGSAAKSA